MKSRDRIYILLLTLSVLCFSASQGQERYPKPLPEVDLSQVRTYSADPLYVIDLDPEVMEVINSINLDTLLSFVNILSGEEPVSIEGSEVRIQNRRDNPGNDLAADFIKMKLESYGLNVFDQTFENDGRNVFAVQTGAVHPGKEYILCAHYDAVADYCADDNASGVAAVLEAARILSQYALNYTLIYALFDLEEIGLVGSRYYASQENEMNTDIQGVLNMDMIAWDSDGDRAVDIHSNEETNSDSLGNVLLAINTLYDLNLNPVIYTPGTGASDHSSFWEYGHKAVLLIEGYYADDLNPYYHSVEDRIDKFDLNFFHDMSKLAIGSISTLVELSEDIESSIVSLDRNEISLYPNPFIDFLTIEWPSNGENAIEIYSANGQLLIQRTDNEILLQLDLSSFPKGVYFITIRSMDLVTTRKIIKL